MGWRLAGGVVLSVMVFVGVGRTGDYHERFAAFWYDEAPRVEAFYGDDVPPLLAVDDGIDAFAFDAPAISGIGLMLDDEALAAFEDGRLVDLAVRRGHDRISSVAYLDTTGFDDDPGSDTIRDRLRFVLPDQDLDAFTFRVEYVGDPLPTPWPGTGGRYAVIAVERR